MVNGGVALIDNGIVEIAGSSGESVKFLPLGGGGLEIADQPGQTSAFNGKVSGFGGGDHSNNVQFINLPSVTFNPNVSRSYVSANGSNTSGTLFVSSGGLVAAINFVGPYSAGNFHLVTAHSFRAVTGTVTITDPVVPNGGSVNSRCGPVLHAAQRYRSAGHRLRRADDACLFTERDRRWRHADGERWPAHGGASRSSAITWPEALPPWPTAMAAR